MMRNIERTLLFALIVGGLLTAISWGSFRTLGTKANGKGSSIDIPSKSFQGSEGLSTSQLSSHWWRVSDETPIRLVGGDSWHDTGPTQIGEQDGPASGRILSVDTTPTALFIGSAGGGLWESLDSGKTWIPRTDHQASLGVSSIVSNRTNPLSLYAATGGLGEYPDSFYGAGILHSSDGGETWSTEGVSVFGHQSIHTLAINPNTSRELVAGADKGIYESSNSGKTWTKVWSPFADYQVIQSIQYEPGHNGVLFASGVGVPLLKSTDGGRSWDYVFLPDIERMDVIYAAYVAVAPSNPDTIYDLVIFQDKEKSGLWVSHDAGQTWTRYQKGVIQAFDKDYPQLFGAIAVDPLNANHVVIGAKTSRESTDGGRTWDAIPAMHVDVHAITFDSQGNLFFGTDGGIWEVPKVGDPRDLNGNLSITQFYPGLSVSKDGTTILGGTQDNGTLAFFPKTWKQWSFVQSGDGGYTAPDFSQSAVFYDEALAPDRSIIRWDLNTVSKNVTPNYKVVKQVTWVPPIATLKSAPQDVLVGGDRVYESRNQGQSWQDISPLWTTDVTTVNSGIEQVTALAWPSQNVIYAGTQVGDVFATYNDGKTWTNLEVPKTRDRPAEVTSVSVVPGTKPGIIITLGEGTTAPYHFPQSRGNIFYLKNAGPDAIHSLVQKNLSKTSASPPIRHQAQDWVNLMGNLPASPVESSVVTNNHLYVGTAKGVYRTTLDGIYAGLWSLFHQGIPNVPVVSMVITNGRMYAATSGRGVWETELSATR